MSRLKGFWCPCSWKAKLERNQENVSLKPKNGKIIQNQKNPRKTTAKLLRILIRICASASHYFGPEEREWIRKVKVQKFRWKWNFSQYWFKYSTKKCVRKRKSHKTPQIFKSICCPRFISLDALLKTDIQNRILIILTIEKLTKFWPFWKQNIFQQKPQIFGTFPKKSTFSTKLDC